MINHFKLIWMVVKIFVRMVINQNLLLQLMDGLGNVSEIVELLLLIVLQKRDLLMMVIVEIL